MLCELGAAENHDLAVQRIGVTEFELGASAGTVEKVRCNDIAFMDVFQVVLEDRLGVTAVLEQRAPHRIERLGIWKQPCCEVDPPSGSDLYGNAFDATSEVDGAHQYFGSSSLPSSVLSSSSTWLSGLATE